MRGAPFDSSLPSTERLSGKASPQRQVKRSELRTGLDIASRVQAARAPRRWSCRDERGRRPLRSGFSQPAQRVSADCSALPARCADVGHEAAGSSDHLRDRATHVRPSENVIRRQDVGASFPARHGWVLVGRADAPGLLHEWDRGPTSFPRGAAWEHFGNIPVTRARGPGRSVDVPLSGESGTQRDAALLQAIDPRVLVSVSPGVPRADTTGRGSAALELANEYVGRAKFKLRH